jgi:hypothetical protein
LKFKQNNDDDNKYSNEFHSKFLKEFVNTKVTQAKLNEIDDDKKYCKIPINNDLTEVKNINNDDLKKQPALIRNYLKFNNSKDIFSFKIKKLPKYELKEMHTLMYEEVTNLENFILKYNYFNILR